MEPEDARGRLRRHHLAGRVRRQRRAVQPSGDRPRGVRAGRGPESHERHRSRYGRADDHGSRHRGAEAALPPEDPVRGGDLVSGILRAGCGLGSCCGANAHRTAERALPRQRPEGLVVVRAHRGLLHPRRPQRSGLRAARRAHVRDRGHACTGRRGAPASSDHRQRGVQRDLLHGRRGAAREPARRDRRRVAGRDDDASARTRDTRVRAHRHARRTGEQADRTGEEACRRRSDDPRSRRPGVDRAAGPEADELPLADDADANGHPRSGGIRLEAALVGAKPAAHEACDGDPRGRRRRLLASPAAPQPRQHDRSGDERDPAQHHRRARTRSSEEPLMQFAFTEEQELLRREARTVLANGGWGRDELADLGLLDRAVLFEEAGRANRGEEFFDSAAPEDERLAALALEAVGIAAKALELGIEHAKTREQFGRPIGVYQAVAHPLADTYVKTELARSLAYWAAWSVSEREDEASIAVAAAKAYAGDVAVSACERSIQVHGGIGFTWEHVLHHYYKRALWIQAYRGYPREQRAKIAAWLLDREADGRPHDGLPTD